MNGCENSPQFAEALGEFVAYATPPPNTQQIISDAVVDCIGCIFGGANSEVSKRVAKGLGDVAGAVPMLGTDDLTAPGYAALRMGVAGHSDDFDDWEEPGNTHPTVVIFPALFAAAHLKSVSGPRF